MLQFILFNILVFWLWWLFSGGFEACTRCVVSTAAFPFSKTMYSMGRCTLLFICMSICYGTQSWRSSKCRDRASEWAVNSNQHFPPPLSIGLVLWWKAPGRRFSMEKYKCTHVQSRRMTRTWVPHIFSGFRNKSNVAFNGEHTCSFLSTSVQDFLKHVNEKPIN